jgi:hypothetical protein
MAGWSEKSVENMLGIHGHLDQVGLAEVDAPYAENVVPISRVTQMRKIHETPVAEGVLKSRDRPMRAR